jgi:hypothetical protein
MKLIEAIENLEQLSPNLIIYISNEDEWTNNLDVVLIPYAESNDLNHPEGIEYFMEVETAKEVVEGWSYPREGKKPSIQEKVDAIIYYAKNDAPIPLDCNKT